MPGKRATITEREFGLKARYKAKKKRDERDNLEVSG